jgi:hypothetical protein
MYYQCEKCGASMDAGEACDCGGNSVRAKDGGRIRSGNACAGRIYPTKQRKAPAAAVPMPAEMQRFFISWMEKSLHDAYARGGFEYAMELKKKLDDARKSLQAAELSAVT